MQFRTVLLGLSGLALLGLPAFADPITYVGKLDKLDIVVELTGDPATYGFAPTGRYHYRSQGADIPLLSESRNGSRFVLAEEEACKETCEEGKFGPIAALWSLTSKNDGALLEGTWKSKKRTLNVRLERVGIRPAGDPPPVKPLDLYNFTVNTFYQTENPITIATSPYDFLRLNTAYDVGEKQGWPDATFVYVTDPRTKFPRPRIHALAGRRDFHEANDLLQARHWVDSIAALSCKSLQYAAFQEYGPVPGGSDGNLGYYDETQAEVLALTPKVMSWRESGSIFCGGAHPTNYSDKFVMDVATGKRLWLSDMFKDVSDDGVPGEALLNLVRGQRDKQGTGDDSDFEEECLADDMIAQYLSASVKRDGDNLSVVFGLSGLPHVIAACGDDYFSLPVADVEPLLTPQFAALLK